MKPRCLLALLTTMSATFSIGSLAELRAADDAPAVITVSLEDCTAERKAPITKDTGILSIIVGGKERLVKKGVVEVDGATFTLYLPKAKSYSVTNTAKKHHAFENTSTLISIDQNADQKLDDDEGWFASLPIRLGDKMFDVVEIATDASRMTLRPSKSELRGIVVGRSCPPFSFKTAEGKAITNETLAKKPFILDIWSTT